MRRLFEEFPYMYNQEKHYKTILKQHWQFIFLKCDVL